MNQKQKQIIEEVTKDKAVDAIFRRIEKEHESKIARIARYAVDGKEFYLTIILESYELLEVTVKPAMMLGTMGMEVEISVF